MCCEGKTDRDEPDPRVRRLLRAGKRLGLGAVILLGTTTAVAQAPARAAAADKAFPEKSAIASQAVSIACETCAAVVGAVQEDGTAPAQMAIAAEDAHILQLAAQLKLEVDRCAPDTLQADVVRKANLIRRLADELKKEIKQTLRAK